MTKWILSVVVLGLISGFIGLPAVGHGRLEAPLGVTSALPPGTGDAKRGGELLQSTLVCTECHGSDFGGKVMVDDPVFGRVVAPNLTRGRGGPGVRSLHAWDLGIRHGVGGDGRPLVMMPSDSYASLSARDLRDVAAWLDALVPVDRELPPTRLGPVGSVLMLTGKLRVAAWGIKHDEVPVSDAPVGDRGAYLVNVSGCRGCHGPNLEGHEVRPGAPWAPSLTAAALKAWTREDFSRALQKGVAKDGHALDELMPWRAFAALPEEDVAALWATLRDERDVAPASRD